MVLLFKTERWSWSAYYRRARDSKSWGRASDSQKEEEVKKVCQEKLADLFKEYTGRAKTIVQGEKPELRLIKILSQMKILEKDKELLTESENIDEITENVRATSKLIESIKREIGL